MASVRESVSRFGKFLSSMVMPNIGAFIAWGFLTALFIETGWLPNAAFSSIVGPMLSYLIPILIAGQGGEIVGGKRGRVIASIAIVGAIVGSEYTMLMGAMLVGPLAGWIIKKWDAWSKNWTPAGFEMLVDNFSLGILGLLLTLFSYVAIGPFMGAILTVLTAGVQVLIGDSQSIERGLSSFGSEMEELKKMLDESEDRALLLIDEIASGTNPSEGLALTRAIIDHLKQEAFITLITTHFERFSEGSEIVNLQVTGLANADLSQLDTQLKAADGRERVGVIRRFMDYRLQRVDGKADVPHDALHIAQMLGIGSDIINKAKDYLR